MNLEELKRELASVAELTGIPCDQFGIAAGGAMLFYGLRDSANDIDVTVPHEVFETLYGRFKVTIFKSVMDGLSHEKISIGNVDIHTSADTEDYLHPEYIMVDGFKVETPQSILAHKERMGRSKDQVDIIKLRGVCNQQG